MRASTVSPLLPRGTSPISKICIAMGCSALRDVMVSSFFFFQAEDGIRDYKVTGVQTCALPILPVGTEILLLNLGPDEPFGGGVPGVDFAPSDPNTTGQVMQFRVVAPQSFDSSKIGRASCRERV